MRKNTMKYIFPNLEDSGNRLNISLRVEKYRDKINNFDGFEIAGNFHKNNRNVDIPSPDLYTPEENVPGGYFYALHTEYAYGYVANKTNILPFQECKRKKKGSIERIIRPKLDWYSSLWIDNVMHPSVSNAISGIGFNPHIIEVHPPDRSSKGLLFDIGKFIGGINYLAEKLNSENRQPTIFLIENRGTHKCTNALQSPFLINDINSLIAFKTLSKNEINIFVTLDFGQLFSVEYQRFYKKQKPLKSSNRIVKDIIHRLDEKNLHEAIRGFHFYAITRNNGQIRQAPHKGAVGDAGDVDWAPIVDWIKEHYRQDDECYILYEVHDAQKAVASYKHLKQLGL